MHTSSSVLYISVLYISVLYISVLYISVLYISVLYISVLYISVLSYISSSAVYLNVISNIKCNVLIWMSTVYIYKCRYY